MKDLVRIIAVALVDNPSEVTVTETEENGEITLLLHVSESDMGKVIGKQGKIAKAIRTVVKSVAAREDKRVNIEIG